MLKLGAINVAVAAIVALVLLAALEAWLRLTIPASSGDTIYAYTLDTARYKVMKPSSSTTAWGKALRTNDLGFRDDAPSIPPKRPGEFRIVTLGDSFTVAAGVEFADIYTSGLQRQLRRQFAQVRVINLGVGGYNVVQYALVLQEVALGLEPDLLLVSLLPDNDFSMETYARNHAVASGREAPPQEPSDLRSLYAYQAYGTRLEERIRHLLGSPADDSARKRDAGREWNENAAALKTIAQIARQRGIPMEVALLPMTWHFERQRGLFARVETLCRELQLSCVNLLEMFIAAQVPESSLRLNAIDSHPNERYQAFVAERLASVIRNRLPSSAL